MQRKQARQWAESPVRTCVGCRERDYQDALFRVGFVAGRLVADERRRIAGRGAYVHCLSQCLEAALRRGGFARAFRAAIQNSDADALRLAVAARYRSQGRGLS